MFEEQRLALDFLEDAGCPAVRRNPGAARVGRRVIDPASFAPVGVGWPIVNPAGLGVIIQVPVTTVNPAGPGATDPAGQIIVVVRQTVGKHDFPPLFAGAHKPWPGLVLQPDEAARRQSRVKGSTLNAYTLSLRITDAIPQLLRITRCM